MAIDLDHVKNQLLAADIDINADFYTLPLSTLSTLVEIAKTQGYRRPKNANGSTARYFFHAVQRLHNRSR